MESTWEQSSQIMKVAIYCRVSTTEQTTKNQEQTLIEYAHQKGWEFDVFEETMSTRKTRPVKQELLAKLRAKQYEAVLVYKLDRWARSAIGRTSKKSNHSHFI